MEQKLLENRLKQMARSHLKKDQEHLSGCLECLNDLPEYLNDYLVHLVANCLELVVQMVVD